MQYYMTSWDKFDTWMQQHNNNYINDFAVLINRAKGFVLVDSPWPVHEDALTLSISILCRNSKELFELLNIETYNDLYRLRPEHLLIWFYRVHTIVFCKTNDIEYLWFQIQGNTMFAGKDGEDIVHEIKELLVVPEDFFRYTNEYFRHFKTVK